MKNFLLVALTFTSITASAQMKMDCQDPQMNGEGIVYNPLTTLKKGFSGRSVIAFAKKMISPLASATELCNKIQFKYAQILNRDVESLSNNSLFSFIDQWWGTKYRYGGTTKKGIDCSSFTGKLMNTVFGFTLPRTARAQYAMCTKVKKNEMLEGDLVFFNTHGGVSHVGVYLGEGNFVHSCCSAGVTINNLEDSYYKKRFIAGGRPECVDYTSNL